VLERHQKRDEAQYCRRQAEMPWRDDEPSCVGWRTDASGVAPDAGGMTPITDPGPPPAPYFHHDSGAVRFWVLDTDGQYVGAIVRKEILHFCFHGEFDGGNAVETYLAHRGTIEAAVRARIARGSIEPVLLRESDLTPARQA
jgi:hypothetical protein